MYDDFARRALSPQFGNICKIRHFRLDAKSFFADAPGYAEYSMECAVSEALLIAPDHRFEGFEIRIEPGGPFFRGF